MIFLFSLFGNLWVYRIFSFSFFLGVLVLVSAFWLTKNLKLFVLILPLLIFFQVSTTQRTPLSQIGNDDRRLIDLRLRAYPQKFLRIGHWLEERKESVVSNRVAQNFFEDLDPNLYFFANSPRPRVGIREFEKFPYILLPVFFLGVLKLVAKKSFWFWFFSFFIPLVTLSLIGNKNSLGSLLIFPFFVSAIYEGLLNIKINWLKIIVFVLVFIQIISYEIH